MFSILSVISLNSYVKVSFFNNHSISNKLTNLQDMFRLCFRAGPQMCALLLVWVRMVYSELFSTKSYLWEFFETGMKLGCFRENLL